MLDPPVIDLNTLSHLTDQNLAVKAFGRMRELFNTHALRPILVGKDEVPGPDVQTDEQILEDIKSSVLFNWQAACTCKIESHGDAMAILDLGARVRGVAGLRVVDASSFPTLSPGHPQSTVCKCFVLGF
jgi:choline dehydrogenase